MTIRPYIKFVAILLAVNLCGSVASFATADTIVLEVEADSDSEKEESKNQKEVEDKLIQKTPLARSQPNLNLNSSSHFYLLNWIAPTIEVNSPPPESV